MTAACINYAFFFELKVNIGGFLVFNRKWHQREKSLKENGKIAPFNFVQEN